VKKDNPNLCTITSPRTGMGEASEWPTAAFLLRSLLLLWFSIKL